MERSREILLQELEALARLHGGRQVSTPAEPRSMEK